MVTVNEQMLKQLQLINKQLGENQKSLRKQHATLKETKKLTENAEGAAVDFKDGLSNLKSEIVNVTNVTKNMNKSIVETLSQSKMWTAASRLLSGTGLWSVQNAVRGVIDVVSIYQTGQEKKIEISQKATKAMENYAEVESRYREEITKLAPALREAEAGNYDKLKAESASFRLMLDKNIEEEVALGLLKREINAIKSNITKIA